MTLGLVRILRAGAGPVGVDPVEEVHSAIITREAALAAGTTAAVAALILLVGPAPGDAPSHLYRTFLVSHGVLVWDNFWYAGGYPVASYSLLYYAPASLIGNLTLVLAAAAASSALAAGIVLRQWGLRARWSARAFAVLAAAPAFTGLYSYALGFLALLATVRALQARKRWLWLAPAALTLGFSPLAFAFLCLIAGSWLVVTRWSWRGVRVVVGLAALAGLELLVLHLFPTSGVYTFHLVNLLGVVGVSATGALLALRSRQRSIVAFFVLWGLGSIVCYAVPTPIGDNWTRLGEFAFPVMLLTATLARFRPRPLAVTGLAGALAYTLVPFFLLIPYRLDNRPASEAFWQPALTFLARHLTPGYRVEVVPTAAHWESYWIPRAGFALARGWYRQLDMTDNAVLYDPSLDAMQYQTWLRRLAVEYVLLPHTTLDPVAAPREAQLLSAPASGLSVVYRSSEWTIYRLRSPTPLLTGPARARVTLFGHTAIAGSVPARGSYLLRVHYTTYWHTTGIACIRETASDLTTLTFAAPGRFSLVVPDSISDTIEAAAGDVDHGCHT